MSLLSLVPLPWRVATITALVIAVYGAGWIRGLERGEDRLEAFKLEVERAADAQAERTAGIVASWRNLKEASDVEAQNAAAARDAALERERLRGLVDAHRRIVPAAADGTGGNSRICFADRDELDRRIGESIRRLRARVVGIAFEGQRGIDLAAQCHAWAVGLAAPATPR